MAASLILLRHGQSDWNLQNRFTGWVDVDLSEKGVEEAKQAGQLLKAEGIDFDVAYTSVLKRAIRTLWLSLDQMDMMWLPVTRSWKLNERHYGALQGLNKTETAAKYGDEQVHIWRRSFDILPPLMDEDDEGHPNKERRYKDLSTEELPGAESLKVTLDRVLPYFDTEIKPQLEAGKNVLIVAHGNSLRALVKHLEGVSDEDITGLNIPTGQPLLYKFDDTLTVTERRYLADADQIAAAEAAVAAQGKAK